MSCQCCLPSNVTESVASLPQHNVVALIADACDQRHFVGIPYRNSTVATPVNSTVIGLPQWKGNSLMYFAQCTHAKSTKGRQPPDHFLPYSLQWKHPNGLFSAADTAAINAACHCEHYPLHVNTAHGVLVADHGNPLTRAGVAEQPTFAMPDGTPVVCTRVATDRQDAYDAYCAHVEDTVAQSIRTCAQQGATVMLVHNVGCLPQHAGDHNLDDQYDSIVRSAAASVDPSLVVFAINQPCNCT